MLLSLVFLATVGISVTSVSKRIGEPFAGFVVWDNLVVPAIGEAEWPGIGAGVPLRSVLESADGEALADEGDLRLRLRDAAPGREIEYVFRHDGEPVTVHVPVGRLGWRTVVPVYLPYMIAGAAFFSVGLVVFYFRPGLPAARAGLVLGVIFGSVLLLAPDVLSSGWLSRAYFVLEALMPAALLHFALCFPEERSLVRRWPWLCWAPYVVFLPVGVLQAGLLEGRAELHLAVNDAVYVSTAAAGLVSIGALIWSWLASDSPLARQQAKVVLAGVGMAAFFPSLGLLAVTLFHQDLPLNFLAPFFLAYPLSIGWAIARHDLFSVDRYLRLAVVYAVLSVVVFVTWAGLVFGTEMVFGGGTRLPVGLTPLYLLVVVAFFNPLRVRVQRWVDRLFYRQEYTYRETIQATSRELASVLNSDRIAETVLRTLVDEMGVEWAAIVLVPDQPSGSPRIWARPPERASEMRAIWLDGGLPLERAAREWPVRSRYDVDRLSDRERLPFDQWGTALVLPVRFQERPVGLIFLGDKMSRAYFSDQDLHLLETLTDQCALAFTNAEAYEIIARTQRDLVRAERLAAVGELASAVAHGIRNPLAGIRSSAQVGRGDLVEGIDASESFDDIISEADRLERRVRSVLEMARPADLELQDGDLCRFLRDYGTEVRARLPAAMRLTVDLDRSGPPVRFDAVRLTEVLDTLVVNAVEAQEGHGSIRIDCSFVGGAGGQDGEALITVSDEGPGIASEVLDQVFDLFFTSKPQGTGVGLAMARRLVEQQGGRLDATSAPGEGARFHVRLRLAGNRNAVA